MGWSNSAEERIRSLLNKISYKPGWNLEIVPWINRPRREWEPIQIRCTFPAKDVDTGEEVKISSYGSVHPEYVERDPKDEYLMHAITYVIRQAEEHEFREWFKVDGFCVYDPHPEERKVVELQGITL